MKKLCGHEEIQIHIFVIVQRLPFEGFIKVERVCEWEWEWG